MGSVGSVSGNAMTFLDQMNHTSAMKLTSQTTYSVQSEAVPSKPWPMDQRLSCGADRLASCCPPSAIPGRPHPPTAPAPDLRGSLTGG